MKALNISGRDFCDTIGITHNRAILMELRSLNLVRFFKVGRKYMYPVDDVQKVNNMLINGDISIKTSDGYYVTINKTTATLHKQ